VRPDAIGMRLALALNNMFTGIIETTGTVKSSEGGKLTLHAPGIVPDLTPGASVAVDGVCLTATHIEGGDFVADTMPETEAKTIIGTYKNGQRVNLELPLRADGRFDGHMVTGHVEGMGEIISITEDKNAIVIGLRIPETLSKYAVPKGSIALNGISLTVIDVSENQLTVSIIPMTWERTNLQDLSVNDKVNIETDVLAKYAEKFLRIKK